MAFFFATAHDLLTVLLSVEAKLAVVYTPASFTPPQRAAVGRWVVEYWGSWMGWEEPPPQLVEWWAEAAV